MSNHRIQTMSTRVRGWFGNWLKRGTLLGLMAGTTVVAGCGISTQQEIEMGAQYATEINRQLPIVQDAQLHNYLNQLGNEIARFGQRRLGYRFYIVNADMINAFAVPGGHVYINRGLIERADNMSEVAGVLAHEIAHVEHRHGVAQMERIQRANIGLTLGYVLLGRAPTGLERAAIEVGGSAVFASYSRQAELEADASAVPMLAAANIQPNGLVTMFQKLLADQQRSPSRVAQWFSTHPTTPERIAEVQQLINRLPATQLRNARTNTAQFQQFQQRMRAHAAPPPEYRQR
jgi:beta-barrel assembly-enhancing protease